MKGIEDWPASVYDESSFQHGNKVRCTMCLIRWTLLFAIFVVPFHSAFAQTSDWAVVAHLLPGQKIKVETAGGKTQVGDLKSVTEDSIRIGKHQPIQKQDVQRVSLRGANHRGRNALIGFGVGAGLGFASAMSCTGRGFDWGKGACTAVMVPMIGGMGAGFGALVPTRGKWQEVYQAASQ